MNELESNYVCVYCGCEKQCREHVIPVSYLGLTRSYNPNLNWIVPSCNKCNQLAGNQVFFSIPEKAEYIIKEYRKKYRKIILSEDWTEEEINELDYNLRNGIKAQIILKELVISKIEFLETVVKKHKEYLMPDFIKNTIIEIQKDHEQLVKENKKKLRQKRKNRAKFSKKP